MIVRTQTHATPLDWQRVAALSSSFALHVLAVAIVAIPLARSLPRAPSVPIDVTLVTLQPPVLALPQPPDPLPLPHTPVVRQPPTPIMRTRVAANPAALPIEPSTMTVAVTPAPISASATPVATAAGQSRVLAYDGALHLRYPVTALREHQQGRVLLRVLVDAEGRVQRIQIERGSGHAQLDMAAREAVQAAHFRPVLKDGKPVPAWGLVPIEFRLDRS
ncbi:MAG: energy transducer TonB [Dokdonella sp.]